MSHQPATFRIQTASIAGFGAGVSGTTTITTTTRSFRVWTAVQA